MISFSDFEINIPNTENNKLYSWGWDPTINMKSVFFLYIPYTQSEDFSVLFV